MGRIARELTKENVPTPTGKRTWWVGTVRGILSNEKYKGDVLLQKSYIRDFLTKKQVPNDGTVQQYYIQGNHEPIIPEDIFDTVQGMLLYRDTHGMKPNTKHPFSGLVFCSQCGRLYGPRVWHSNDRFRKVVWSCNGRYGKEQCRCKSIDEDALEQLFIAASKEAFKAKEKTIQEIYPSISIPSFKPDGIHGGDALRDEGGGNQQYQQTDQQQHEVDGCEEDPVEGDGYVGHVVGVCIQFDDM